jgi:hypothetical protein
MLATQTYQTSLGLASHRTLASHLRVISSRIAGVVLPVEMCEVSEVSELSPGVSKGASHRRGYVSSFWNFSDAGEQSGKVTK